jgi:hypothetical protein
MQEQTWNLELGINDFVQKSRCTHLLQTKHSNNCLRVDSQGPCSFVLGSRGFQPSMRRGRDCYSVPHQTLVDKVLKEVPLCKTVALTETPRATESRYARVPIDTLCPGHTRALTHSHTNVCCPTVRAPCDSWLQPNHTSPSHNHHCPHFVCNAMATPCASPPRPLQHQAKCAFGGAFCLVRELCKRHTCQCDV